MKRQMFQVAFMTLCLGTSVQAEEWTFAQTNWDFSDHRADGILWDSTSNWVFAVGLPRPWARSGWTGDWASAYTNLNLMTYLQGTGRLDLAAAHITGAGELSTNTYFIVATAADGSGASGAGTNLTAITFPDGIWRIGGFEGCTALAGDIVLPASVIEKGGLNSYGFKNCSKIESMTFPTNTVVIPNVFCFGCSGIKWIFIPDTVVTIQENAFAGCSGWTNNAFNLPANLQTCEGGAFVNCPGLTGDLVIPEGLTYLCNGVIPLNMRTVTLHDGITNIDDWCFSDHSLTNAPTLPKNLTSLGKEVFRQCYNMKGSMAVPDCVTNIGEDCFYRCQSLTQLTLPKSLATIGNYTMRDCQNLREVHWHNCPVTIGNGLFDWVNSDKITNYVGHVGWKTFCPTNGDTFVYPANAGDVGSWTMAGGTKTVVVREALAWESGTVYRFE